MVELVPAMCPKCGANLQLPDNLEKAHCVYCGTEIIIEIKKPDIHYHGIGSVENYLGLANIALKGENCPDAVENYTKALQMDMNSEEAWLGKAMALKGLGNYKEAVICCNKAIAINPKGQGRELKEDILWEIEKAREIDTNIKTSKCFIATAAYGTPMAEEINVLREWRDETLMDTISGRALVKIYYTISPPIAGFISTSERLRAITRLIVNPFVHFARVSA